MNRTLGIALVASSVLLAGAGTQPVARTSASLTPAERVALRGGSASSLESLRAGRVERAAEIAKGEREALVKAQRAAAALATLRAGELHLTDRELKIIAVVLLAVLTLAVIT